MIELVLGPVCIAGGLATIYVGLNGLPRQLRPSLSATRRRAPAPLPEDTMIADILSEMLRLREEKAQIEEQLGAIRSQLRMPVST